MLYRNVGVISLGADFMLQDLVHCKDRVEYLLQNDPTTRDCDKKLWLLYLFTFHDLRSIDNVTMPSKRVTEILLAKDTPTAESIRRIRQKFQESGMYVGTKRKKKIEESEKVKDWSREIYHPKKDVQDDIFS